MSTFFAPQLIIPHGITDISFYTNAFDAVVHHYWKNDDGSIHVAELSVNGALFHLHEDMQRINSSNPQTNNNTTVIIGLFVPDVDAVMEKAIAAGAVVLSAATSYDYGYRQGEIKDPFGHIWMIEMKI
jgi:PhnB protein